MWPARTVVGEARLLSANFEAALARRLRVVRGDRRRDSRQMRPANLRLLPDAESLAFAALAGTRW